MTIEQVIVKRLRKEGPKSVENIVMIFPGMAKKFHARAAINRLLGKGKVVIIRGMVILSEGK